MMDLSHEIQSLMWELESPFLVRHHSRLRCNCISSVTGDASATCLQCGGSGMRYTLIPIKAVRQLGASTDSYPFLLFQGDMGKTAIAAVRFYMRPNTLVRTADEIWEVDWRDGAPIGLRNVYEVAYVDRVSELNFREVYLRAYGHPSPQKIRISRFLVKKQAGLPIYEPVFEGGKV